MYLQVFVFVFLSFVCFCVCCKTLDPSRDLMLKVSPSQAVVTRGDTIDLTCSAASAASLR